MKLIEQLYCHSNYPENINCKFCNQIVNICLSYEKSSYEYDYSFIHPRYNQKLYLKDKYFISKNKDILINIETNKFIINNIKLIFLYLICNCFEFKYKVFDNMFNIYSIEHTFFNQDSEIKIYANDNHVFISKNANNKKTSQFIQTQMLDFYKIQKLKENLIFL